jgi:hypothetical protein
VVSGVKGGPAGAAGDFPSWMIESLDWEARRLGVTRQAIIKLWIAERLERGRTAA